MSTLELNSIIAKGESETVEFKSNFNVETIETLVAFANSKGGCVYVGINDIGEIKGVSLSKESIQKWTNEIKNKTEPSLLPDIEIVNLYNKKIVVISVNEYPVKPISIKGRHYKRIGNSNHLMNVSEVSDCYMLSMQYSWDSYIRPDSSLKDIDSKRIKNFINRINKKGRVNLTGNNIEKLKKLKLIIDNKPTNAAMLLFAKDPLLYDVHAGRLKTPDLILDDKIIRNTLFELVEETMQYIISHLKVAYEISAETVLKTTQRTEIFEYPLEALRELVLNAVIHRKYNSPVDIQIKIFDNKISMFNPGELYGNITIEDLQHDDYQASARNKLIVEAFYLTGDIEKYGTGYRRIREALKNYPTMK
ncbi:MAG: ATP-dependent DNA helicase, partial [Bacteroidetes bacterium CG_4_10_14_3_um_filter_31_20]